MAELNEKKLKEIEAIVYQAVADAAGSSVDELTEHTELITTLNMDSLALFELAIELEEAFSLRIPDEDIDEIATIRDVISYLVDKIN